MTLTVLSSEPSGSSDGSIGLELASESDTIAVMTTAMQRLSLIPELLERETHLVAARLLIEKDLVAPEWMAVEEGVSATDLFVNICARHRIKLMHGVPMERGSFSAYQETLPLLDSVRDRWVRVPKMRSADFNCAVAEPGGDFSDDIVNLWSRMVPELKAMTEGSSLEVTVSGDPGHHSAAKVSAFQSDRGITFDVQWLDGEYHLIQLADSEADVVVALATRIFEDYMLDPNVTFCIS